MTEFDYTKEIAACQALSTRQLDVLLSNALAAKDHVRSYMYCTVLLGKYASIHVMTSDNFAKYFQDLMAEKERQDKDDPNV
jgi:hypothetical protein